MTLATIKQAVLNFIQGKPTQNQLQSMSKAQLLTQINYDAADGRINTIYSREYDRRRAANHADVWSSRV